MELSFAAKPAGTKFYRPVRSHLRQCVLSPDRRGLLSARGGVARVRCGQAFLRPVAGECRVLWIVLFIVSGACLLQLQTRHLHGWQRGFNIHGAGRFDRLFLRQKVSPHLDGRCRIDDSPDRHLCKRAHSDDRSATNSSRCASRSPRRIAVASIFREWRLRREMRKADIKGQLESANASWKNNDASIEKQLKKEGRRLCPRRRCVVSPDELAGRPKPKVVDTTALPEEGMRTQRKPSLAELQDARKPRPRPRRPTLSRMRFRKLRAPES